MPITVPSFSSPSAWASAARATKPSTNPSSTALRVRMVQKRSAKAARKRKGTRTAQGFKQASDCHWHVPVRPVSSMDIRRSAKCVLKTCRLVRERGTSGSVGPASDHRLSPGFGFIRPFQT
eukprot:356036-Chlamydomonas_euryale.AAC.8